MEITFAAEWRKPHGFTDDLVLEIGPYTARVHFAGDVWESEVEHEDGRPVGHRTWDHTREQAKAHAERIIRQHAQQTAVDDLDDRTIWSLRQERARLEARLAEINDKLGERTIDA
ncbi:hypothetical protein SEA_CACTOJAQUE_37 [Mycobacterium phage Cactojaque]|nr:hypothetical protein SEA_MELPOMINI_38 [Mycobacterium phage Melpomini]QAY08942.1 hypothetical protein SEA_JUSTHALL_38 [Mycobacterium phage JustHall]QDF16288.1 hypothetical protein SEA_BLACKBRAIN_37 [Mycobacterium phage Blackbrain]QFP97843.1 hypothetical protein SEA_CACTOJAQUE_37 [Mycobacterium phage Cactojaque]